jgi:nucleotide-binding universal stress UspA family protein
MLIAHLYFTHRPAFAVPTWSFLVAPYTDTSRDGKTMYEHLLVALDGSEAAEHVLPHAEAVAVKFGSTVTLLRAVVSAEALLAQSATGGGPSVGDAAPALDPTPIVEADRDAAIEYLAGIERRLQQHDIKVNTEHPEGPAEEVIVERARKLGVGLILMTTHGRSGLGRIVFGSVADSVLRHAACPVLLVRVTEET